MRMFSTATHSTPAVAWARSDAQFKDLRFYADAFELDIVRTFDRAESPAHDAPDDIDEGLALALEDIKERHAEVVLVDDEPDARSMRRLAALDEMVRAAGGELHTRLGPFACFDGAVSPHVRQGLLEMRRLRLEEKVLKLGRQTWFDRMRLLDCRATYGYCFAISPMTLVEQKVALAKRGCEHVFADRANVENSRSRPELRRLAHIAADGDTIQVIDVNSFGRAALALPDFLDALDDKAVTVVDQDGRVIWPLPREIMDKIGKATSPAAHRLPI